MIYQVFIRPLINLFTYSSTEVEVTQYLNANQGIGRIRASVDSTDFVLGVFSYTHVKLKFLNYDGVLSDSVSTESIFNFQRDRAKVRIVFRDFEFTGLINDEATKEDEDSIEFTVISNDSIIRKTSVTGGLLTNNMLFSEAIFAILNRSPINNTINVSASNIHLDIDERIDDVSSLENVSSHNALNELLVVSNSFLYIDSNDNAIVSFRTRNTDVAATFYGDYDPLNRSPQVLKLHSLNNGTNRAFNSFVVNEEIMEDTNYINAFGFRRKDISADFITSFSRKRAIASNLLNKYRYPKFEGKIRVPTRDATQLTLGSVIRIDFPKLFSPADGDATTSKYGGGLYATNRYPNTTGNIFIDPRVGWIVYEREDTPQDFTTTLKVREYGYQINDSLIIDLQGVYGEAVYGRSSYGEGSLPDGLLGFYGFGRYGISRYGT